MNAPKIVEMEFDPAVSPATYRYESPLKKSLIAIKSYDAEDTCDTLRNERTAILKDMKAQMAGIMTAEYLDGIARTAKIDLEIQRLEICMAAHRYLEEGNDSATWEQADEHISLRVKERALLSLADKWEDHRQRYSTRAKSDKDIIELFQGFITSRIAWNTDTKPGYRENSVQSNLRRDFMKMSLYPILDDQYHCPITRGPVCAEDLKLAHIFPCKHGAPTMKNIFGDQADPMSPRNVMFMATKLEERFNQGWFVIVPDIEDLNETEKVNAWRSSRIKEYKTMVLFPDEEKMKTTWLAGSSETFNQYLDGRKLSFITELRPRARYFAFHYLYAITRYFYTRVAKGPKAGDKRAAELTKTLGQHIWMSPGKYIGEGVAAKYMQLAGCEAESSLYTSDRALEHDDSDIEEDNNDSKKGNQAFQAAETDVGHGTRAARAYDADQDADESDDDDGGIATTTQSVKHPQ